MQIFQFVTAWENRASGDNVQIRFSLTGPTLPEKSQQIFKIKIKTNKNVAGPTSPWIELHSCSQVVGARHPNPAQFGSACVRVCGDVAHGPTLITIGMGGVDIYTTQPLHLLSNVGLNSKANKRETQVFPPNLKHIQQNVLKVWGY